MTQECIQSRLNIESGRQGWRDVCSMIHAADSLMAASSELLK
uniref:Uncharacterized protein n=1 Tax=Anguilla anguilla TaxID=7936 RepID=A0A0E9TU03_ANGAN